MKLLKQLSVMVLLAVVSVSAWAFSLERYVDGVHYKKLEGLEAKPNTVVEFFSYGCPHCKDLEPKLEAWLKTKPESVAFSRVPATWNKKFTVMGHLFYVIEALNLGEKTSSRVFDYIHTQGKGIASRQDALTFMLAQGVSEADFNRAWDDADVEKQVQEAGKAFAANHVRGVPALVVNGQYQTSVSMAGSAEEMFSIVEFLLSK